MPVLGAVMPGIDGEAAVIPGIDGVAATVGAAGFVAAVDDGVAFGALEPTAVEPTAVAVFLEGDADGVTSGVVGVTFGALDAAVLVGSAFATIRTVPSFPVADPLIT